MQVLKKELSLPEIIKIVPDRTISRHDTECRFCNMLWSILVNKISRCMNSSDRGGEHNFHFRKPVETDSQEKQSSTVKVLGRNHFSTKVVPDI